tara:strand:- start:1138 stop:1938 length:801 start_codon:yes stop_codon:yes gene_type:complete
MLGQQFYHETIRKIIVSFGTIFNNIQVVKKNSSGNITQSMKVPLAYGPKQKFLTRIREDASLNKATAITLPRIAFEIQTLSYDTTRKLNRVTKIRKKSAKGASKLDSQYMPVPYNVDLQLFVISKSGDDALQIIEQILPFFQPEYTITVRDNLDMEQKRDVPIVLTGIDYEDNYEGDFTARRAIIYTLSFTAKFYLYGPVTSQSVIKSVQVDQFTDMPDKSPKREQRYTVTPDPVTAEFDDNFGFNETTAFFTDAKDYNPSTDSDE